LLRSPVPDARGDLAAEGVVVRRIVGVAGRVTRRAASSAHLRGRRRRAESRPLRDRADGAAIMFRVARAEPEVLPLAAIGDVNGAIELRPGLLIESVDELTAEYPAEGEIFGMTRRKWLRVIDARQSPIHVARDPIQGPEGASADSRSSLRDILRRRLAVTLGPADLPVEAERLRDEETPI